MVIPDVILSWPKSCDYPLWRKFISENRIYFNEVIIAFTETHQEPDYSDFIKRNLTPHHVQFVTPPQTPPGEDWRHIAVTQALLHSYNAEWIWFTEQDYILGCPPCFMNDIKAAAEKEYEIMAHYEDTRMHPASIVIKRGLLNKTRKQFGIIPNKHDHFYKLQQDIEALQSPVHKIEKQAIHLNGLSHNMSLIARGEAPNYHPQEVNDYIRGCLTCGIELDERWKNVYSAYINRIECGNNLSPTPPLNFSEKIEAKTSEKETP